MIVRV